MSIEHHIEYPIIGFGGTTVRMLFSKTKAQGLSGEDGAMPVSIVHMEVI